MYLEHFKLRERPFLLNANLRFTWLGPAHQEALATLCYGVRENKGLLLLTGDIGTGKTTLISTLIDRLKDDNIAIARMVDPGLNRNEFFFLVAHSFGIQERVIDKESFTEAIEGFLEGIRIKGKKALLIIDEAQIMSSEILEEVRLLSNLECHTTKLLNTLLVGQNELELLLLEPQNRSIRERISISYNLLPLTENETRAYIAHRLQVAGADKMIFSHDAISRIHTYSKGYLRLINILCDLALLFAFKEDATQIDRGTIESCKERTFLPHLWNTPLSDPNLPAPPNKLELPEISFDLPVAQPPEVKAPPKPAAPVKLASRTMLNILLALLIFLPASYLLFAGLKRVRLSSKPSTNPKVLAPAGQPNPKTMGLIDPLPQPSSSAQKVPSSGKNATTNITRKTPAGAILLGRPGMVPAKALSQGAKSTPEDKKAKIATAAETGRSHENPPPPAKSPAVMRSNPEHRLPAEKTLDGRLADKNKPAQDVSSKMDPAKLHRPPSEPPDPAAIIDWLLREKSKGGSRQSP